MKARLKKIGSPIYGKVGLLVQPEGVMTTYRVIITLPEQYQPFKCTCCNGYHYPSLDGLKFAKPGSLISLPDDVELTPYGE